MGRGQTTQEILLDLEGVTGARIRSRHEARTHVDEHLARRVVSQHRVHRSLHTAKNAAWLLMLACAFLQYHTMELVTEIVAMPSITPDPTPAGPPLKMLLTLLLAAIS